MKFAPYFLLAAKARRERDPEPPSNPPLHFDPLLTRRNRAPLLQGDCEQEIISLLLRRFEGKVEGAEVIEKEDLGLVRRVNELPSSDTPDAQAFERDSQARYHHCSARSPAVSSRRKITSLVSAESTSRCAGTLSLNGPKLPRSALAPCNGSARGESQPRDAPQRHRGAALTPPAHAGRAPALRLLSASSLVSTLNPHPPSLPSPNPQPHHRCPSLLSRT